MRPAGLLEKGGLSTLLAGGAVPALLMLRVLWGVCRATPAERALRQQEQTVSIKRFGEDLITLQQRIDGEKLSRESELNALRGEIHDVLGNRNLSDEQFKVRPGVPPCPPPPLVRRAASRTWLWRPAPRLPGSAES